MIAFPRPINYQSNPWYPVYDPIPMNKKINKIIMVAQNPVRKFPLCEEERKGRKKKSEAKRHRVKCELLRIVSYIHQLVKSIWFRRKLRHDHWKLGSGEREMAKMKERKKAI